MFTPAVGLSGEGSAAGRGREHGTWRGSTSNIEWLHGGYGCAGVWPAEFWEEGHQGEEAGDGAGGEEEAREVSVGGGVEGYGHGGQGGEEDAREGVAQADRSPGSGGDDADDQARGGGDGGVEGDVFLCEVHQGICAGKGSEGEEEHPAVEVVQ